MNPGTRHPAALIAERLENAGIRWGYSNYWVSEVVRYYSKDHVCLVPNPDLALHWRRTPQIDSSRLVLIWVPGLDKPQYFTEAVQAIEKRGYRCTGRWDQGKENWSVYIFEK
jgi:hypothetical protein